MRVVGLIATAILAGSIGAVGIAAERPVGATGAGRGTIAIIQRIGDLSTATDWHSGLPTRWFMRAVVAWLVAEFDLPSTDLLPAVAFAEQRRMVAMRYGRQQAIAPLPDVAAVYDDREQTVYLPANWTGRTAAELSLLVHEMVHHLQNIAGMTYECPEAREKPAYAAQDRWLALTGSSLATEFGIDPMTLLVRTSCFH